MEFISFLNIVFVAPFVDMASFPTFFAEVVISGLLTGIMYSLVALGFVLIFKASGVFNFAQGAMVLFAALTLVGFMELGVPVLAALLMAVVVMTILAFVVERFMLRHLINQEGIILFMATIGLIELDMGVLLDICDRVTVLDYGRKIADGTTEEVRVNQDVI